MAKQTITKEVKTTGSFFKLSDETKRKLRFVAGADEELSDQTKVVNTALDEFFERWQKESGIKIPASKKK
jgi:hypothetical protein